MYNIRACIENPQNKTCKTPMVKLFKVLDFVEQVYGQLLLARLLHLQPCFGRRFLIHSGTCSSRWAVVLPDLATSPIERRGCCEWDVCEGVGCLRMHRCHGV